MPDDPPGESEWHITSCKSCEREIKIPSDVAESDMVCPYCSARLDGSEPEAVASQDPKRQRRRSQAGAKGAAQTPEWDQLPSEAEDDDINEYVEVDPNNPDAVRVRRVRRKRTLTPAEKVVRTLAVGGMGLAGIACIAILIIALVRGTDTASHDIEVVSSLPENVQNLIEAARTEGKIPTILTEAETAAAEAVLRGYLEADSWGDKLAYVHNPNRAALRMERWYDRPENSDATVPMGDIRLRDKLVERGRFIIKLAVETFPGDYKIFALRQTLEDIKVDWEPSVGYQEMLLEDFKQRRITDPVPFRVKMQTADYYGGPFSDEKEVQSVVIYYPGDPDFQIFGYIRRDNEKLSALLKRLATEAPNVVVTLAYPNAEARINQVIVVDEIAESWFE